MRIISKAEADKIEARNRRRAPLVVGHRIEVRNGRAYRVVILEPYHPGVSSIDSRYKLRDLR